MPNSLENYMALVIPPGYGQASFVFTGTTGTPEFITTLGVDLREYGGDFQTAANQLFSVYSNNMMTRTSTRLTLQNCTLTVGDDAGTLGSVVSNLPAKVGDLSGANGPLVMSVLMQKRTARLGRAGRGRSFLPGLLASNDVSEGGSLGAPTRAAILEDWLTAMDALSAGDVAAPPMPQVLLHDSGIAGSKLPDAITGYDVAPLVGIQRKRIR